MSTSDKTIRQGILRRRALFISSVTALSGCSPTSPVETPQPAPDGSSPVVHVEPTTSAAAATSSASATPAPQPAPRADMPSMDTPADINKVATERFDYLRTSATKFYATLDELEANLPVDCPIVDASCKARWQQLAKSMVQIDKEMPRMPPCRGTSKGAKLYEARVKEHRTFTLKRKEEINAAIAKMITPHGKVGEDQWQAQLAAARSAFPQVCLRYACKDW